MQAQSPLCRQPRVKKAAFADPRLSIFALKFLGFFGEFIIIIDGRGSHSTIVATPPSSSVWKVRYLQNLRFSEFWKFSILRFLNFRKSSNLWISDSQNLQKYFQLWSNKWKISKYYHPKQPRTVRDTYPNTIQRNFHAKQSTLKIHDFTHFWKFPTQDLIPS